MTYQRRKIDDFHDLKEITGQERANRARKYFAEFAQHPDFRRSIPITTFTVSATGESITAVDVKEWLQSEKRNPLTAAGTRELKESFMRYWEEYRRPHRKKFDKEQKKL